MPCEQQAPPCVQSRFAETVRGRSARIPREARARSPAGTHPSGGPSSRRTHRCTRSTRARIRGGGHHWIEGPWVSSIVQSQMAGLADRTSQLATSGRVRGALSGSRASISRDATTTKTRGACHQDAGAGEGRTTFGLEAAGAGSANRSNSGSGCNRTRRPIAAHHPHQQHQLHSFFSLQRRGSFAIPCLGSAGAASRNERQRRRSPWAGGPRVREREPTRRK